MRLTRLSFVLIGVVLMGLAVILAMPSQAAPTSLEAGGLVVPLGAAQADLRAAYREPLAQLYSGGRLHQLVPESAMSGTVRLPPGDSSAYLPSIANIGDLYMPPQAADLTEVCQTCTRYELAGTLPISRAYALYPGRVAVLRSSAMVDMEDGEVVAMWEIAEIRQVLDGYLMGAVPYDILSEQQVAAGLHAYDMLIIPAFRNDARDQVLGLLDESGALGAMQTFVERGGTLYAQGSGLHIAEAAGALPPWTVDPYATLALLPEDAFSNQGQLRIAMPASPMAYSWVTDSLYILDDPILYPDEGGKMEIIAEVTNVDWEGPQPAVIRYPYGSGQVIGVVGHPTDPTRRNELPLFMNALLLAFSGRADFYGDAIQTFNSAYPPHEFPAYEVVPVSATLHIDNLWDAALGKAVVTETVSPGYTLTGTVSPEPSEVFTTAEGHTVIVWDLGELAPHAQLTLRYQAQSDPETLAAGIGTFSTGDLSYTDLSGKRVTVQHPPFVLTARMAARLVGDRDLEADRHFNIPAEGIYLDIALPLENKEETLASSLWMTDWVYLIAPIVDIENQHVILNANDGETIWMRNEPYLWGEKYPLWQGATAPTQTLTLDDWRAMPDKPRCIFTSTYGIHTEPPLRAQLAITDYGSFVTIPPTYSDAITVVNAQLLLPCYPLTWDLGDFPGYWYEEPAVRYGIHSRELVAEREIRFHGTPREDTVVMPYDAGSVYVLAGTYPVPYRQYLEHETPYAAQAPSASELRYQDVWSRTHTLNFRASFYDVWDWDSCATCGGLPLDQHAGSNLTFGLEADLDKDGIPETFVREIPTRLPQTRLTLLGKTYSATYGDPGWTIPPEQNLIDLPIFHGLGVRITPEATTWWDSYRSLAPGHSELITVVTEPAYDHLYFQQDVPLGSSAAFVVSATIHSYEGVNKEADTKIHDGTRMAYHQMAAGPNRYEVYDGHVHAPEGLSSDGAIEKRAGPMLVSVYSDTLIFAYDVWDLYDARDFARDYDPFIKSWGYGDLVWTTYVGGREAKTLFSSVMGPGDRAIVRVALDNNTGITLTGLSVDLGSMSGIQATRLYTDPSTAPEPIWPEMAFLNLTEVPDAWRSVWYFEIAVDDVADELWGQVLDIPVQVTANNLPAHKPYDEAPAARIALQRPGDPAPRYISGPADALILTDTLPANVALEAAAFTTDAAVLDDVWAALDVDTGDLDADTAGALFATLAPTRAEALSFTVAGNVVTFNLGEAAHTLPLAKEHLYVLAKAKLSRAQHGPNLVNAGAGIRYTDPFGVEWSERTPPVTVEAHGAAVWVDYYCGGGWEASSLDTSSQVVSYNGECTIPDYGPSEVVMDVTAYNAGDAIARSVTVTLALPQWVTATEAYPAWEAISEQQVTWHIGDLAPGQWKQFTIVLYVEPYGGSEEEAEAELRAASVAQRHKLLGIHHSDGAFFDDFSKQTVSGQVGDAFWFNLRRVPHAVYVPLILRSFNSQPDLVIKALVVDAQNPAALQIEIANEGRSAAGPFWVDVGLDPETAPQVNQVWHQWGSPYGAAWEIERLAAGEVLTLRIDSAPYDSEQSNWHELSAYPAGAHEVWAYIDAWGYPDDPWGGVSEFNEDNNLYGPVSFTVSEGEAAAGAAAPDVNIGPRPLP